MLPQWLYSLPWQIIQKKAAAHGLDPILIASIIMVESTGNPCATRFEPGWQYFPQTNIMRDYGDQLGISTETVKSQMATSWGSMQIMGATAFDHGFRDHFVKLCEPEVGIEYGVTHLRSLIMKYGSTDDAIAAYNAGSPRKTKAGTYVNERYVDKVMRYYRLMSPVYAQKD